MARSLDGVELRAASGRWPAGTLGTVVEAFDDGVMIEIADDKGRGVDLLELPHEAVAVVPRPKQERLAV
jgi:hypothetical protein